MLKRYILLLLLTGCHHNYDALYLKDGSVGVVVECKTEYQCIKRINEYCIGYDEVDRKQDGQKITVIVKCRKQR